MDPEQALHSREAWVDPERASRAREMRHCPANGTTACAGSRLLSVSGEDLEGWELLDSDLQQLPSPGLLTHKCYFHHFFPRMCHILTSKPAHVNEKWQDIRNG